jgi:putative tricarboxylic transport membrane protein
VAGAIFVALKFPVAPILLGYVLGPMVEENFRRAVLLSRGDLMVFIDRPISAAFISVSALLILAQMFFAARGALKKRKSAGLRPTMASGMPVIEED